MYFCIPWGILANVKISRLSALSSWLCDLFPSCVALGLRPRVTHEGNKSHNPLLQADNPYLLLQVMTKLLLITPALHCLLKITTKLLQITTAIILKTELTNGRAAYWVPRVALCPFAHFRVLITRRVVFRFNNWPQLLILWIALSSR